MFQIHLFSCSPAAQIQSVPTGVSLWMGAHDSITEGGWTWTDGSPFRYINWAAGEKIWDDKEPFKLFVKWVKIKFNEEDNLRLSFTAKGNPDDYYGEDCLSILINSGAWNDDDCENKRGYICKRRGTFLCPFHSPRNNTEWCINV